MEGEERKRERKEGEEVEGQGEKQRRGAKPREAVCESGCGLLGKVPP